MGLNLHGPEDQLEINNTEKHSSAGRMEKRKKRARGPNWNHAHTLALAELRREASLNKEGGGMVWERIAQTLSSRFPGQMRTGKQCRRRWDTLVKVFNHIENYCVETGVQGHRELDKGELASMKLDTAYRQDWYDIVEQVCSQRRRNERCDRDLRLAKRSKDSHSVELPERPPRGVTLCPAPTSKSVTRLEQSTSTYAQVSSSPSLEAHKLGPEEGVPRLRNENDGSVLQATQVRQHGQTSKSADLPPHTSPSDNGTQLKAWLEKPIQDVLWDLVDAMPTETSAEMEQPDTVSELTEPFYWDVRLESIGLGAQPKEPLYDHGPWKYRCESANASRAARESFSSPHVFSSHPRRSHKFRKRVRPSAVAPSVHHQSCGVQFDDSRPPIKHLGATPSAFLSVFDFLEALLFVCLGALLFLFQDAWLF